MGRPKGYRLSACAWRDLSKSKGLSITEVSEITDIQRATISGMVGGHARASLPMAQRLADALGCEVGTLFPLLSPQFSDICEAEAA